MIRLEKKSSFTCCFKRLSALGSWLNVRSLSLISLLTLIVRSTRPLLLFLLFFKNKTAAPDITSSEYYHHFYWHMGIYTNTERKTEQIQILLNLQPMTVIIDSYFEQHKGISIRK